MPVTGWFRGRCYSVGTVRREQVGVFGLCGYPFSQEKTWGASQGATNVDFPNRMIVGQRWDGYLDVSRNTVEYLGSVQKWGLPKNCNFMTE